MISHNHVYAPHDDPSIDEMIRQDQARQWRDMQMHDIVSDTMRGVGSFYTDGDHADALLTALQRIIAIPGIRPDQRWQLQMAALEGLAQEWATYMTSDDK